MKTWCVEIFSNTGSGVGANIFSKPMLIYVIWTSNNKLHCSKWLPFYHGLNDLTRPHQISKCRPTKKWCILYRPEDNYSCRSWKNWLNRPPWFSWIDHTSDGTAMAYWCAILIAHQSLWQNMEAPVSIFFRNLHLRENLARDCFTSTASTVTNSVQNIFSRLRYCDK